VKATERIDLGKLYKDEYVAPKQPALVKVGPATYLGITGKGVPGEPEFAARIGALYAMAYTVKMTRKFAGRKDYTIGKLETQYWTGDTGCEFSSVPRGQWRWRLLIRTPDFVKAKELEQATTVLLTRGKPPEVKEVGLVSIAASQCVQLLHVGPYDRIGESVAAMKAFAEGKGLVFHGLHHEIYLSDPRRVAPEKLKTILREPVRKA
jgi:hypothetical protein